MGVNNEKYSQIITELAGQVTLVAVSKLKTPGEILELYKLGQRDFGENYVQELLEKEGQLPKDIRWHFIGHLQSNKVKYIAPFVHLIHGVDSLKLLEEIDKQGRKLNKVIKILLQVHIAEEETKYGFNEEEVGKVIHVVTEGSSAGIAKFQHIEVSGFMGMASNSDDERKLVSEFNNLNTLFKNFIKMKAVNCQIATLSMGMSGDYKLAIKAGSNMVRIGSLLFGRRDAS